MDFCKSVTRNNLAKAYASECQDSARFQLMALLAFENKQFVLQEQIKKLAMRELAHATVIFRTLLKSGVKDIENIEINATFPFENIECAKGFLLSAQSEHAQAQNIYPDFASIAKDEGFDEISNLFIMLSKVEEDNERLLKSFCEKQFGQIVVCTNCGYYKNSSKLWNKCPLCGKEKGFATFALKDLNK